MKNFQTLLRKYSKFLVLLILLTFIFQSNVSFATNKTEQQTIRYVPNQLLIQFKKTEIDIHAQNGKELLTQFLNEKSKTLTPIIIDKLIVNEKLNKTDISPDKTEEIKTSLVSLEHNFASGNGSLLNVNLKNAVFEVVEELAKDSRVEMVTPNYIGKFYTTPSESNYSNGQLWGVYNDGSTITDADYSTNNPGTSGVDIDAASAWGKTTGSSSVIVAVLDSGIDYDHSDLDGNMWDGSSCVDEDGNSLNNCVHGYDYINSDLNPMDDYGHGTAMAGVIGATQGDGGVVGLSWLGEIMAIKIGDSDGPDAAAVIDGIDFARENGAHIINASFGFDSDPANLEDAIERFVNYDGLFIASAGNTRDDLGTTPSYPAAYDLDGGDYDNLISVAATDQSDEVWDTGSTYGSNYGDEEVDLGAPGANILSTYWVSGETDEYNVSSGTSRAAAYVSGTAALLKAYRSDLTSQQIKLAIMESGDNASELHPSTGSYPTVTGKRLNAYNALLATEEALVVPTIKSTTTGGNWNSTSTWVGGSVPISTDVVEIDGTVTLNTNATVSGLIINSDKTLRSYSSSTYTLTLSGDNADFENNGTVDDYSSGHINITVGGNAENNGTLDGQILTAYGNLINTGTFSMSTTLYGDLTHSGTSDSSTWLVFDGSSEQNADLSGSLGNVRIYNDVNVTGDLTATYFETDAGYTFTFGENDTLTVNGNVDNEGDIEGGDMIIGGGNVYFYGDGGLDINSLTFSGTGTKTSRDNKTISGDLIVGTGVNLRPYGGRATYFYYVNGDTTVDGSITTAGGYYYGRIYLMLYGSLDNNGTMNNYATYAYWDSTGADSYDFQVTNTSDEWQSAESTGTYTFKDIHSYRTEDRRWRWRSVNGGTPGDWSADRFIN